MNEKDLFGGLNQLLQQRTALLKDLSVCYERGTYFKEKKRKPHFWNFYLLPLKNTSPPIFLLIYFIRTVALKETSWYRIYSTPLYNRLKDIDNTDLLRYKILTNNIQEFSNIDRSDISTYASLHKDLKIEKEEPIDWYDLVDFINTEYLANQFERPTRLKYARRGAMYDVYHDKQDQYSEDVLKLVGLFPKLQEICKTQWGEQWDNDCRLYLFLHSYLAQLRAENIGTAEEISHYLHQCNRLLENASTKDPSLHDEWQDLFPAEKYPNYLYPDFKGGEDEWGYPIYDPYKKSPEIREELYKKFTQPIYYPNIPIHILDCTFRLKYSRFPNYDYFPRRTIYYASYIIILSFNAELTEVIYNIFILGDYDRALYLIPDWDRDENGRRKDLVLFVSGTFTEVLDRLWSNRLEYWHKR